MAVPLDHSPSLTRWNAMPRDAQYSPAAEWNMEPEAMASDVRCSSKARSACWVW